MADSRVTFLPVRRFGETTRRDAWWAQPLVTFTVFFAFVVYVTWALLQGTDYWSGNLLSPLYSPELFGTSPHALLGPPPAWLTGLFPAPLAYSPAMLILIFPLAFRMTCYYYRGAYYKAFWADPPNCAVGEPRKKYLGERYFPLVIQNVHRYALYFALIFIVILSADVWTAMWFAGVDGLSHFGMRSGKATAVGGATAIVVGLVAITPAAGFVSPMGAIILGALAAFPSYYGLLFRARTRLDDSLDVVAAHGLGGTVGALLTGVLAQKVWNGVGDGLLFGNPKQLGIQAVAVAATIAYSGIGTFVLLKVIGAVMK